MYNHLDADIDECSEDNGGCSQYCSNTFTSYLCNCDAGYSLELDHNCIGIVLNISIIFIIQ